jgi:uncharacterized membrane protein YbhN (UPF0104 family)
MSNVTRAVTRAIRNKFKWNWIAAAISLLIITIAGVTLLRLFREIEIDKVIAALKAQSLHGIVVSCGFVAMGYVMLTCYDLFALRAIGRDRVPYRVAAFASFTSYTVGHNFGAPLFTSAVIRYRIYSAWGLSVVDIAKIAFVTGLTYWLGNAVVLGCGFSFIPSAASAIDDLPVSINRVVGVLGLLIVAGYVLWLLPRPRIVGRPHWRLVLPGPKSTLIQIGIGVLDLTFVALAMYALLPSQPPIGVFDLIVIFVTAMLIGVLSYAPGSLGVIEAAMFIALPQFQREGLLASLLVFRVLYFVIPLLLAVLLLGSRELWVVVSARRSAVTDADRCSGSPYSVGRVCGDHRRQRLRIP